MKKSKKRMVYPPPKFKVMFILSKHLKHLRNEKIIFGTFYSHRFCFKNKNAEKREKVHFHAL